MAKLTQQVTVGDTKVVLAATKPDFLGRPRWDVTYEGEVIGTVGKSEKTWERRSPGKRYVNARGTTPCWANNHFGSYDTRRSAIADLIRRHETK